MRPIALAVVGVAFPVGMISAQQACLPANDRADFAVTYFLQIPREAAQRQTLGIAAVHVEQLRLLTDAADASLCRRMDSVVTPRSVYYSGGGYIIGSNLGTDPNDSRFGEHTPYVFVFDSAGWFRYRIDARLPVVAPASAHATSPRAGLVTIDWTNQSANAMRYQLQRRDASTPFVAVGPPALPGATSASDSTAVGGASYYYRVDAVGPAGDSTYSNEVGVVIPMDLGPVTRASTGLLYRDTFDRPDGPPGSDWVAESGTWQIVNNTLQVNSGSASEPVLRLAALPARMDFHVQVFTSRSNLANYAALYLRRIDPSNLFQADMGSTSDPGRAGVPRVYRKTGGSFTLLGYGTASSIADTLSRLTFSVLGSSQRLWADGVLQVSATDANNANNGYLALEAYTQGGGNTVRYDDLIVCAARTVTVAGLPAGYQLRVAGIVSSPAVNGSATTIDLLGTRLPASQVEILDTNGMLVKTYAPADGVWGGDRYSVNGAP